MGVACALVTCALTCGALPLKSLNYAELGCVLWLMFFLTMEGTKKTELGRWSGSLGFVWLGVCAWCFDLRCWTTNNSNFTNGWMMELCLG